MDLWLASPTIFLVGFVLLYVNSGFARVAGLSIIASALAIAASPGDVDNWYMAAALGSVGAVTLLVFRPRWLRAGNGMPWQFSLRGLLVGTATLGACLAFNLWVGRHVSEQLWQRRSINPILMDYQSTVGILDKQLVWLSVNGIPPYDTLGLDQLCGIRCSRWITGPDEGKKPFGDADLAKLASEHQGLRYLDLRHSSVTDRGLSNLANLSSLKRLWLDSSQCTQKGLANLHYLKNLERVSIDSRAVSQVDLANLRQALPECEIRSEITFGESQPLWAR